MSVAQGGAQIAGGICKEDKIRDLDVVLEDHVEQHLTQADRICISSVCCKVRSCLTALSLGQKKDISVKNMYDSLLEIPPVKYKVVEICQRNGCFHPNVHDCV